MSTADPAHSHAAGHALAIYRAALDAVRADALMRRALRRDGPLLHVGGEAIDLDAYENVTVVGAGKASAAMAAAAEALLGDRLAGGVVVTKYGHGGPTRRVRVLEAGHPVPDEQSVAAGREIHALASRAGARDLVIALISGGASALMELPAHGVSLEELRETTEGLLRAGADIGELNTVRACLSQLKAGGLVRAAAPARVVCLLLSDVLGSPPGVIGSGPCVESRPDPAAARAVLARYGLRIPTVLSAVDASGPAEPAAGARALLLVVGDIWTALDAARSAAAARGLRPCVLTGWLRGEAREVAQLLGGIARDLPQTRRDSGIDCFVVGGETTVTVRGAGRGGRSQEIACAAAGIVAGAEGVALLAAGTDGTDGPTDAAGGLVDGGTAARARAAGLDAASALRDNDTYPWLASADALLVTGPTHTNVGDLVVMVCTSGEG